MAPRNKQNRPGFALIFAAVLTAALALTVASVASTAGVMQQQAAARKWSVMARSLAEQGMSRALAEATAVAVVRGDSDMDRLLDPDGDDTARCPVGGCTTSESPGSPQDNNVPAAATVTVSGQSYGNWGSALESFGGQNYRRVNSGSGAYLVRFDDNLDDNAAGLDSTTTNNTVLEGGGTDTPNRDRDQHIFITAVGFAGGTTESTARARHIIRAVVRTKGGKTVRAGSYVDTGTNGDICGNGLQMCRRPGTTWPACWCGELEIDTTDPGPPPSLPASCADCAGNCPPASFREVAGLCAQLAPGPPKPPDYITEITKRSTYGTLISDTSLTKGACLFRVDVNRAVDFGPLSNGTAEVIVHLWDSTANAACASTTGSLPSPDFDFDSWNMGGAQDCWIPVYVKESGKCPYIHGTAAGVDAWVTPECNIQDPATAYAPSNGSGSSCKSDGTMTTSGVGYKFCPGRAFGGNVNAMDSIVGTLNVHELGGGHKDLDGARTVANTAGGIKGNATTNGQSTVSWANLCGCAACGDTNTTALEFDASTGNVVVDANGPKGVYLVYQGNNNATLTVNNDAANAYSKTGVYFAGQGNITIAPDTFMEGPPPWPSAKWAMTNKGNCFVDSSNNSKTGFRKGIWCEGNVTFASNNGVMFMGDVTAGDDTSVANISGGKNSNYWCNALDDACPNSSSCSGLDRGTIWSTGNVSISDNGGGTGPDVCMDIRATLNLEVVSNANNGWVSGTIWVGGNATGPRLQVDPSGGTMMGATPSVLSFQSFSF